VGERVWPTYLAKALGMFFSRPPVLALMAGLAQINPIWLYGPYRPADVSAASQPDWYMGWLDGALRLMPNWEIRAFGYEVPNPFFPGVLLPGIYLHPAHPVPWLEARFTRDRDEHHLLDRPRDRPLRTAFGVADAHLLHGAVLRRASDVIAITFGTSINFLFRALRVLLFVLPRWRRGLAFRLCKELALRDQPGRHRPGGGGGAALPGDRRGPPTGDRAGGGDPGGGHGAAGRPLGR
jgi:ubiquinol-cytochrome c reductase cytochrome b subunit